MDEDLLYQEVENIRKEILSKFFIDYIVIFITVSIFIFILTFSICQCFAFLVKSIWGIAFLFLLSGYISLYLYRLHFKEKMVSNVKNLLLNTGIVYNNIRITKSKDTNDILEKLIELDLDYNYFSTGNIYNLAPRNHNQIIQVGIVYLQNIKYSGYERYYSDNDSYRRRNEKFKYVRLSSLKHELIYRKFSNIQTGIIFLVPDYLFDYEKAQKEGIKFKKVGSIYSLLVDDDSVKQAYESLNNGKEYKLNIDMFKKIDKEKIFQIMEDSIREPREIINIAKKKGVIKCI